MDQTLAEIGYTSRGLEISKDQPKYSTYSKSKKKSWRVCQLSTTQVEWVLDYAIMPRFWVRLEGLRHVKENFVRE